jgi:hypothetical protein
MLSRWKHEPLLQPNNSAITKMRNQLSHTIIKTNSNISRHKETPDEREQKCFYFAIKKITGFNQPLNFWSGIDFISSINIENYFDQITTPKVNDLVVYTKDKNNLSITHFAVVKMITGNNIILHSKWGSIDSIIEHGPFDIPMIYGKTISFFTLKNKYKNDPDKKILHAAMTAEKAKNDFKLYTVSCGPLIIMTIGIFYYTLYKLLL